MKSLFIFASTMVVLLIVVGGCTGQPSQQVQPIPVPTLITPMATPPQTAQPLTLTSQGWNLGWYDDTKGVWSSVIKGDNVSIWFGMDGNISGSAGCTKYYSAAYQTRDVNTIQINRPKESTTTCQAPTGVISQDSMYFTDLGWAASYVISGDQLQLFDSTGKKILQFDRMT